MQLKKAGRRLLAGIALLLGVGAAVSIWSLEKVGRLSSEAAQEGRKIERLLMSGARVQTDFQVQIQEFKNVLLRGEDAELFKKHLDGFRKRRDAVQEGLDDMSQALEAAGMDKTPAEQLLLTHSELSFRYGEAVKLVRGMGVAAAAEADRSVRGIDRDTSTGLSELRAAIDAFASQRADERAAEIATTTTTARQLMIAVTLIGGLAVLLSVHAGLRRLLRLIGGEPGRAVEVFARIATGDLTTPIPNADVDGSLMAELARMQQQLRQRTEAEQQAAAETLRIKRALDNAGACMMLVGSEGTVVYANQAMQALLAERAAVLACAVQPLAGQDFAGLLAHTPAAAWAAGIGGADDPGTCEVDVSGVTLALVAKGVFADDGQRIGTVVEWQDHTAGVQAERQIASLIDAALRGDFSHRVPLQGKAGFYLKSAEGLNDLAGVMAEVVTEVGSVLNALSGGDLTQKIAADYQGKLGELKNDTNSTVDRLRDIVSQLQLTAEAINAAAADIAAGNADISRSTEAQASALEETASSMEELNATVRQNADNARQANELAVHANDAASSGGRRMAAMVATMNDIQQASQRIEAIIGVIDAIAFQTNILALNAAVEAARAGEQGRGFAVVASEVRNLAKRSAEAAREIKGLIADSVSKVGAGVTLVEQFGHTMQEIVVDFQRLSALVTDIADASSEQSTGIDQVTRAVTQMDTAMQQNAARVEEAAAAAVMLTAQSTDLARMVSSFRIEGRGPARAALPALPRP